MVDILTHPPGMAGISGTAPEGETCGSCRFWRGNSDEIVDADEMRWIVPLPKPRYGSRHACWRYRQIRRGQLDDEELSRRIPRDTPGCSQWLKRG